MKNKNHQTRRQITSEQIESAMKRSGLTRKQLADKMGKHPSEVTKWLSGSHNFTSDLLSDISSALNSQISGVERTSLLVSGYGEGSNPEQLCEPIAAEAIFEPDMMAKISRHASDLGISIRTYLNGLVEKDLEKADKLPKVDLLSEPGRLVKKYAGIVKYHEITGDDRFERIWNK